ncbi:Gfo/Idh/MocA family protein [Kribbella sp. CA-293567]|uniref:Gfo/Idh/MocA family protein n=1 Tax=Kribbella sp. CA-293567 TaxID=3002436 RepID=UPI0022DD7856|nr:Gfo/Idh/MocA family oxidoreductase [Kribbella sp. CA-293567]WBQ06074.1 Gfo/Idh/MocA family oxidoreductase [Kribbella sp. CA-293567]
MTTTRPPAVALAGTSGYGRRHLDQLLGWHAAGRIRLAALVDLDFSPETRQLVAAAGADPVLTHSVEEALDRRDLDLAVVATPPHTHFPIARTVLRNGLALYLEKPPVPLLQQLDELTALTPVRRTEVGFQLARASIEAFEAVLATGAVGEVSRITAHGCLARPDAYYARNAWAGSWFADGQPVLDGPLFNPLAHIVHTALTLARRIDSTWTPETVQAEHYAVHSITGDDIGAIRVRSSSGPEVLAVGTTVADVVQEPAVTVHGSRGHVMIRNRDGRGFTVIDGVRADLPSLSRPAEPLLVAVEDLDGRPDPVIDLAAVRPFVAIVNAAVEAAGRPHGISRLGQVHRTGDVSTRTLPGLSGLVDRVIAAGSLFSELGVAWACPTPPLDLRGYTGLSHPELAWPSVHQETR